MGEGRGGGRRTRKPRRDAPHGRSWLIILAIPLLLGAAGPPPAGRPEILWDTLGIPHIYTQNHKDFFYAFGWAQARSHGDLLLRSYGLARGRAAEYWGEQELEDRRVWTFGIPDRVEI
jgi:acyl-homoserine-lactone acylase